MVMEATLPQQEQLESESDHGLVSRRVGDTGSLNVWHEVRLPQILILLDISRPHLREQFSIVAASDQEHPRFA